MKLGLTTRIVLIFVLLAAALLATVGALSYRSARESLKAAIISDMLAVALEKEAVLDAWLVQRLSDLGRLGTEADVVHDTADLIAAAPAARGAHAAHEELVRELALHIVGPRSGFVELSIIDATSAKVLVSTNSAKESELNVDQNYFEKGKEALYLQQPYYSAELNAPAMFAAAPVRGPDGRLQAVLTARLNLDAMSTITDRRTGLHRTEDAFIVNEARFLITHSRFLTEPAVLSGQLDTESVRDCAAGNSGAMLTTDYRGVPVISVYRWIAKWHLGLLVQIDQAEAFAPALALRQSVIGISALALLATAVLALFLAHTITRPLRQLYESVRHFAKRNSEQPLSQSGGDELVLLSRAFSEMEVRVEQRTKELASSLSLLNATLDSTADGILAVHLSGEIISFNSKFTAMWRIPLDIQEPRDRHTMMTFMVSQVRNPDEFFWRIEIAFANPEDEAFDVLELKDGRVIERYVKPQRLDGKTVGLVFNFRDITERKRVQSEIERIHTQLVEASRQAGQAEIATNVLHNVGNVLNSVNVCTSLVTESIAKSRVSGLAKAVALLQEHEHELGDYLSKDPRGKLLPAYLAQLAEHLHLDQQASLKELNLLGQNIEHIKVIVAMQQTYARNSSAEEVVNVRDVVEEALRVNMDSLLRHKVEVVREIEDVPPTRLDKHRALQILVNLMRNARHACDDSERTDKRVRLRVGSRNGWISVAVIDNGVGIPAENLTKIFSHGFTTRQDGHGFGLHGAALTAKQMGGSLRAHSDGVGQGATFTLELPVKLAEGVS